MKRIAALYAIFLLVAWPAFAHSYKKGDIEIGHIWARATPAGATTAAIYGPFLNKGAEMDKLLRVSSPWAEKIELHQTTEHNGISHMEKMDALMLEPGKPVALSPRGMHLMVMGLKRQLKKGEMMPLTLEFEKAGTAKVEAKIEAAGAAAPGFVAEHQH